VDRLGRSLQDPIGFLKEVHALGIDLYLHQQGIDTTTPAGMAMFQMLGVFSEFERALIRSRVLAGLAPRAAGRPALGCPRGRPGPYGTRSSLGAEPPSDRRADRSQLEQRSAGESIIAGVADSRPLDASCWDKLWILVSSE
jgi:DNA invertase Pin-like site-specific DNA recombinase